MSKVQNTVFKKRNIEYFKLTYGGWIGWNKFVRDCNGADYWGVKFMTSIFALGCRVGELKYLLPKQIDTETYPNYVQIKQMYVEKQKDFVQVMGEDGKPIMKDNGKPQLKSMSKAGYRTFLIHKKEPTTPILLNFVKRHIESEVKKGTKKPEEVPIFPETRFNIYYALAMIGAERVRGKPWNEYKGEYYPHLLRSFRASHLAGAYRYSIPQLMKFFGWEDQTMPTTYASLNPADLMIDKQYEPK